MSASRSPPWSAPSEEEAEDIADQIEVEIDGRRTPLVDARDALEAGAPLVHDDVPGNVIVEGAHQDAGLRQGLRTAPHKRIVRSRRARAGRTRRRWKRAPATPPTIVSTGRVTLTCTTQMPHLTRTAIADLLGMPESDLRVIAPDVGGGFGQKMSLAPEYVLLVWLARKHRKLGRLDRGPPREPDRRRFTAAISTSRLEGAFDADAKLIALSADVIANVGAYSCYPDHLRRRAADGDGGNARALRRARLFTAWRAASSPTPARWRPIAACRGRSSPSRSSG